MSNGMSANLISVSPEKFMPFTPAKVLNYYDGPRVFTFNGQGSTTYLACWDDDVKGVARFFVVEVDDATVASIEDGTMSVRDAFRNNPFWVVESQGDVVFRAWQVPVQ